jgi:PPIC-type PPIASE domain
MSTPLVDAYPPLPSAAEAAPVAPRGARLRPPNWLREPLLHFALIGGVLFALDHYLVSRTDDPQVILVSSEVNSEAVHTFERARGRKPTDKELHALHRVWLDNEVLYREGLALGVDKGDPAIRERVIFKALSVVDSNTKLPPADEKMLRAWFEGRREKYDEPARYDFEEGALSNNGSEEAVRSFVDDLNAGTPGDAKAGLRVFKARPYQNLVDSYGPDFARALGQSKPNEWQALQTRDGWRAIRLIAITAPRPAVFETIRGVVLRDWTDAEASQQRTAAVRALSKKYKIKFEDAHQCAADEQ